MRERLKGRFLFCVEDNLDDGKSISTVSLADQNLKTTAPIREATQHVNINTDPPSVREINKAISNMKDSKVAGEDGISADLLQAGKSLTFTILSKFFCEIWISENMLEDWKTGLMGL